MLPSIFNQRVCNDMHSEREKELRAHTLYVLKAFLTDCFGRNVCSAVQLVAVCSMLVARTERIFKQYSLLTYTRRSSAHVLFQRHP